MALNELRQKVKEFEAKAGFDKAEAKKLIEMLQEELDILKENLDNKEIADHQLIDLQMLILQLANRFDTNLDAKWTEWFEKSKKYIKS